MRQADIRDCQFDDVEVEAIDEEKDDCNEDIDEDELIGEMLKMDRLKKKEQKCKGCHLKRNQHCSSIFWQRFQKGKLRMGCEHE